MIYTFEFTGEILDKKTKVLESTKFYSNGKTVGDAAVRVQSDNGDKIIGLVHTGHVTKCNENWV